MSRSPINRRRFLQSSAAALAGVAVGSDLTFTPRAEAATSITWMVRAEPSENAWEQKIVLPGFKKVAPTINVKLLIVPVTMFDAKISNLAAAGNLPDVFSQWGYSRSCVDFAWRGLSIDQRSRIQSDKADYSNLMPSALEFCQWNGEQLGAPINLGATYTFYNKDLFDKAGLSYPPVSWDDTSWNWNEMIRLGKELTRNFDDPAKAQYGAYLDLGSKDEFVWLWGGDVWDQEAYVTGVPHQSHWNTPVAIEAIQSYADLTYVDKIAPSPSVANALAGTSDPFLTGKLAMRMTGIWGFWQFKPAPFRWGVAPLPGMHAKKNGVYADPMLISSRSKNTDAAWQFVKYLSSIQVESTYTHATGAPTPLKPLLDQWFSQVPGMSKSQVQTVYSGALKYGHRSIQNSLVSYDAIRSLVDNHFDPLMLGHAKAKDLAPTIDQQLKRILQRLHK